MPRGRSWRKADLPTVGMNVLCRGAGSTRRRITASLLRLQIARMVVRLADEPFCSDWLAIVPISPCPLRKCYLSRPLGVFVRPALPAVRMRPNGLQRDDRQADRPLPTGRLRHRPRRFAASWTHGLPASAPSDHRVGSMSSAPRTTMVSISTLSNCDIGAVSIVTPSAVRIGQPSRLSV
jgi:hypothetical protein